MLVRVLNMIHILRPWYIFGAIAVAFFTGVEYQIILVSAEQNLADATHSFVSETLQVFHEAIINQIGRRKFLGEIRYHYDAAEASCKHIILLGVGTFMSVNDYNKISEAIAANEPIVVVISDHNVNNFEKTSPSKYASLTNEIIHQLDSLIPVCRNIEPNILLGGHSASGQAAMQAWQQGLLDNSTMNPLGFIGLDPYQISKETMDESISFNLSGLYWGFTRTTCQVTIEKAAQAAYQITEKNARVLYSIHNEDIYREMTHCVFTDQGCGVSPLICGTRNDFNWVYTKVADSIRLYLQSLTNSAPFNKEHFSLPEKFNGTIDVLVNDDTLMRSDSKVPVSGC